MTFLTLAALLAALASPVDAPAPAPDLRAPQLEIAPCTAPTATAVGGSSDLHFLNLNGHALSDGVAVVVLVPCSDDTKTLVQVGLQAAVSEQIAWGGENKAGAPVDYRHRDMMHVDLAEVPRLGGDSMTGATVVLNRYTTTPYASLAANDGTSDCAGAAGISGVGDQGFGVGSPSLDMGDFPASFWEADTATEVPSGVTVLNPLGLSEGVAVMLTVEQWAVEELWTGSAYVPAEDMGFCWSPAAAAETLQVVYTYLEG